MNRLFLVIAFLCIVGCSSRQPAQPDVGSKAQSVSDSAHSKPPSRAKRRESAAVIGDDPILAPLIGEWVQKGSEKKVEFVRNSDKSVTVIHPYPFDLWDSVVDNVRIIDGKLHYDVYYYYTGPESFAFTETNDHPYSGKINAISVWPGDNEDELLVGFSGVQLSLKRSR